MCSFSALVPTFGASPAEFWADHFGEESMDMREFAVRVEPIITGCDVNHLDHPQEFTRLSELAVQLLRIGHVF